MCKEKLKKFKHRVYYLISDISIQIHGGNQRLNEQLLLAFM